MEVEEVTDRFSGNSLNVISRVYHLGRSTLALGFRHLRLHLLFHRTVNIDQRLLVITHRRVRLQLDFGPVADTVCLLGFGASRTIH